MRLRNFFAAAAALLLAGCGTGAPDVGGNQDQPVDRPGAPGWNLDESGGGAMLALASDSGEVAIRLVCRGDQRFLVNVPAFRPVGSEERMTFGQGSIVETMVAHPSGDAVRGGVTASAEVPANLEALLSGRVAANYGSQNSGPHPPLPPELLSRFVNVCQPGDTTVAAPGQRQHEQRSGRDQVPTENVSACLMQGRERLPANNIRAVGTEPFWGATVQGRCVTYSHPDNQAGTRVWTRFTGTAESGIWTGSLEGKPFVMRTRPQPGCSDGMSDNRYPIAVSLAVGGEQRSGCAEPR